MNMPIRLILTDDHAVMRAGLANMLNTNPDFCVLGEAGECAGTLSLYDKLRPDVVLLDVSMPVLDGIETLRRLRAQHPEAKVLMLSASETEEDIIQSFQAGAAGYMMKSANPEELSNAIHACHEGKRIMTSIIERRLADYATGKRLTAREIEVLALMRKGLSNPDIARLLDITRRTAKAHVAAILLKLEAADRTEAVARAFERGLLKL